MKNFKSFLFDKKSEEDIPIIVIIFGLIILVLTGYWEIKYNSQSFESLLRSSIFVVVVIGVCFIFIFIYNKYLKTHTKKILIYFFKMILPNYSSIWYQDSLNLLHMEKFIEALKSINKAIENNQNNQNYWNIKCLILSNLLKHEESLIAFENAARLDEKEALYPYNQGIEYQKMGNLTEALISYKKARFLAPNDVDIIIRTACIYSLQNKPDQAVKELSIASNIDKSIKPRIIQNEDFKSISDNDEFIQFINNI